MRSLKLFIIITLSMLFIGTGFVIADASAEIDNGKKEIKKNFKVKSGQKIILDLEIGVDISIEGWDKNEVDINANITADYIDDIDVTFDESMDGIEVHAESLDDSDNDVNGKFLVRVPNKFDVKFVTMGGDIKINKVDGELVGNALETSMDVEFTVDLIKQKKI